MNPLCYSVLYYKRRYGRSNSSGSKLDGTLNIRAPPHSQVSLRADEDHESESSTESEDGNEEPKAQKRKFKKVQKRKKGNNNVVYSGVNKEVAQQAFQTGFETDECIVLSSAWECMIVCLKNNAEDTVAAPQDAESKSSKQEPNKITSLVSKRTTTRNRAVMGSSNKSKHLTNKSLSQFTHISTIAPAAVHKSNALPKSPIELPEGLVVPSSVTSILRPHQWQGISFLFQCVAGISPTLQKLYNQQIDENERSLNSCKTYTGAILADEMGLGKTLMTIVVLFALHRRNRQDRFIVVCPSSLVQNWKSEFNKWLGRASQPHRVVIEGIVEPHIQAFCQLKPNKSEILILSYEMVRSKNVLKHLSQAKQLGCMVLDEGHRLKSESTQILTALLSIDVKSKILISGTPIQNNLAEFYRLCDFVNPGILGNLSSFRQEYERPVTSGDKETKERKTLLLNEITSTFMLRRLSKDVLKSMLPPRTEYWLFCKPSHEQCVKYLDIVESNMTEPLTQLLSLRQLCAHPNLSDKDCSVAKDLVSLSGKLDTLAALLKAIRNFHPQDKVVLVCNFTSVLTLIETQLMKQNQWSYTRLDGTIAQNQRGGIVNRFEKTSADQCFAFLLSSRAGGCGLNLVAANRLIMVDPDWNPAHDHQAMARIFRPGQTKPCHIYRMFTSGTVEEVILQRQIHKGDLATLAMDSQAAESGLTNEELKDCFTLKQNCDCDTRCKMNWPKYYGVNTLKDQGITDAPLLTVAEEHSNILRYVYVVP